MVEVGTGMKDWTLVYERFEPEQEGLREALCTLGNGKFATRGAAEESEAGEINYPGTYIAGGYNRLKTDIAGRTIENEDLVNFPNWLHLTFRPEGGDWLNLLGAEILSYRQELDLRQGVLKRQFVVRDRQGRETSLVSRRIVHMGFPHLAAIEWVLRPENWSGRIEIRSGLDGRVVNAGVARYRQLSSTHLVTCAAEQLDSDSLLLVVETNQSHIRVAEAARTRIYRGDQPADVERTLVEENAGYIAQDLVLRVAQGEDIRVEKVVAFYTSRDNAISEPATAAAETIARIPRFAELLDSHALAWSHLWRRCDLILEGKAHTQMALRLHIFHLLQTVSPHTVDRDVGVPARGLHGEAYRGHIFWDELFIFPFFNFRIPEITRALLLYRFRRLPEAKRMAEEAGFRGALFPWQSGSSGREETQVVHLNPKSGRWLPDNTHLQWHVNSAIAHSIWRYYETTGNREFLSVYGAVLLLEIARFWASAATWNPDRNRYEIRGIMGPDEFHDRYPWSDKPGLDNNAYTNVMASWVLRRAREALDVIEAERADEIRETTGLSDEELESWDDISRKLFVPFHDGIISQFEGYERLEEFDWGGYRKKYGDIHRLDRILEAEGDTVNRYKASKQADALMLFYLFSSEELHDLFAHLGYSFESESIPPTIDYYLQRSSDGSTLSRVVHSWVLARTDRARAWELLERALESDIADIQGGTTQEGIHLGAMAGTVDFVQRGQTGLEVRGDLFRVNPCLAEDLKGLRLKLRYRGQWLDLELNEGRMTLAIPEGWSGSDHVIVRDERYPVSPGTRLELRCSREDGGLRPVAGQSKSQRGSASRKGDRG